MIMAMSGASPGQASSQSSNDPSAETEILNVVVQRDGQKVSTKWGLHPNLKDELKPEEWKELTEIMGKVTTIVGTRFSEVLNQTEERTAGKA